MCPRETCLQSLNSSTAWTVQEQRAAVCWDIWGDWCAVLPILAGRRHGGAQQTGKSKHINEMYPEKSAVAVAATSILVMVTVLVKPQGSM